MARYCPVPRPVHVTDDQDEEPEYYVPYEDAILAIQDASGEAVKQPDLNPWFGVGWILLTIIASPVIVAVVGAGAIIDRVENIAARMTFEVAPTHQRRHPRRR